MKFTSKQSFEFSHLHSGRDLGRVAVAILLLVFSMQGSTFAQGTPSEPEYIEQHDAIEDPSTPADSTATDSLSNVADFDLADVQLPPAFHLSSLIKAQDKFWTLADSSRLAFMTSDSTWQLIGDSDTLQLTHLFKDPTSRFFFASNTHGDLLRFGTTATTPSVQALSNASSENAGTTTLAEIFGHELNPVFKGEGEALHALAFFDERLFAVGDAGTLLFSQDSGEQWTRLSSPLPLRWTTAAMSDKKLFIAGVGGFLFESVDLGESWKQLPWPNRSAFVQLIAGEDASPYELLALDAMGRLDAPHRQNPVLSNREFDAPMAQTPWLDAYSLTPLKSDADAGWLIGGSKGRALWISTELDTLLFQAQAWAPLLIGSPNQGQLLLAGGSGYLANFHPELGFERIEHDLFGQDELVETPSAEATSEDLQFQTEDRPPYEGPRYLFSALDNPPACTTAPTRLRQLKNANHPAKEFGLGARVHLAFDLDEMGRLQSTVLVSESPEGFGFGQAAIELAQSLTFTPGFAEEGPVSSRMLYRVNFSPMMKKRQSWLEGKRQLASDTDSLRRLLPFPETALGLEKLVKKMSFPPKAKRFLWEGDVILSYRLQPDGEVFASTVLVDKVNQYDFSKHALAILPKLKMQWPDSLRACQNRVVDVVQKFCFHRKLYKRPEKAQSKGFRFEEVLLAVPVPDSLNYDSAIDQLLHVAALYIDNLTALPDLRLDLEVGKEGQLLDVQFSPVQSASEPLPELDILRSLAFQFTWAEGYTPSLESSARISMEYEFVPCQLPESEHRLDFLFQDVVY
jgi:hypothetical protein